MNFRKIYFRIRGFSIIEIIIYLAIFTTISILVINSFIIVIASFSAIRTNHDLIDSGSMASERMSREIRQAKSIDLVNSQTNGGEVLQLNSTDLSGNNVIIKFIKEGNDLNLYKNGTLVGNLLTQNIVLNSVSFYRTSNTNSEGIKIKMMMQDTRGKANKIANFYDTVMLRGGY